MNNDFKEVNLSYSNTMDKSLVLVIVQSPNFGFLHFWWRQLKNSLIFVLGQTRHYSSCSILGYFHGELKFSIFNTIYHLKQLKLFLQQLAAYIYLPNTEKSPEVEQVIGGKEEKEIF